MSEQLQSTMSNLLEELREAHDTQMLEYLTKAFGSLENIEQLSKFFLIEPSTPEITFTHSLTEYKIKSVIEWRLVPKLQKVIADEKWEETKARNVPVGECIVCRESVVSNDNAIQTIHGLYHEECVDGTPGEARAHDYYPR